MSDPVWITEAHVAGAVDLTDARAAVHAAFAAPDAVTLEKTAVTYHADGAMNPTWSHDGTQLAYTLSDGTIHVANSDGTGEKAEQVVGQLRETIVPATVGSVPGVQADVSGEAANTKDFNDLLSSHAPYVFAFVIAFAFVLLLVTFRSIVIPIKAIVLNLLSVGAAYGLLTLVFVHGWGKELLGFEATGAITSWLPLFLFVVLFGLSMDYHVFILSRVREAFDRGMKTEDAVSYGIKSTAGVVTSAAVVMVAVFAIFAALDWLQFKQMGVGLAAAVLIDATIVRGVLLPASMKLLGDWNWYLPKKLEWLPRFSHEGSPQPAHS